MLGCMSELLAPSVLTELREVAAEQRAAMDRFKETWADTHDSSHLLAQDSTGRPIYAELLAAHGVALAAIAHLEAP